MSRPAAAALAALLAAAGPAAPPPPRADAWRPWRVAPPPTPPVGRVFVWGGAFGRRPRLLQGLPDAVRVAVHGGVVAAVEEGGEVCIGVADGERDVVVRVAGIGGRAVDVAVRGEARELVVVRDDGRVAVVEEGSEGGRWKPARVLAGVLRRVNVRKVSCGARHCVAVTSEGDAFAWGDNASGQLGRGAVSGGDDPGSGEVARMLLPEGVRVRDAACGDRHTVLVAETDDVFSCGDDGWMQLGVTAKPWVDGGGASAEPRLAAEVSADGLAVASVSAGAEHSCALVRDGTPWSWGRGSYGALGHHNFASFAPPNPVANVGLKAVRTVSGRNHSCVLAPDGDVWCVGDGGKGQLGSGPLERSAVWRHVRKLKRTSGSAAVALAAGGDSCAAIVVDKAGGR
jgi:alpha-tubulin suppressor-like RCC1 family protein